jgi:hypothetical protein
MQRKLIFIPFICQVIESIETPIRDESEISGKRIAEFKSNNGISNIAWHYFLFHQ